VTPQFHCLVPDGSFVPLDDGMRFVAILDFCWGCGALLDVQK
jgi:hypothetical protein